jgi:hypothetical protein
MKLSPDDILFHRGSLLDANGLIHASYDFEQDDQIFGDYFALTPEIGVANASSQPIETDYSTIKTLHIINGMGVALGDSIIGLTAIQALRTFNPALEVKIYRPSKAPDYVEQLYALAEGKVAHCWPLPVSLKAIPEQDLRIDIGNHVFWPDFSTLPMIDFFLQALGVAPDAVSPLLKRNHWLQQLELPAIASPWHSGGYVLFCPTASTPIRSIPANLHVGMVEQLWQKYALPILGFADVVHPRYVNISRFSTKTVHFLSWIKHAAALMTCDSAAVHAAAGFEIPTTAFFTSILPEFRVRDYPLCTSFVVDVPELALMHTSSQSAHIAAVEKAYQRLANDLRLL